MSDEKRRNMLQQINELQALVNTLKSNVDDAGGNDILASSAILDAREEIDTAMKQAYRAAKRQARDQSAEILSLLERYNTYQDANEFWDHFRRKIESLVGTGIKFREICIHSQSIFQKVCKLDPPLEVVQQFLGLQ